MTSSTLGQPPPDPVFVSAPALQGERLAFTGVLASMTHRQAHDLAVQHGGTAAEHVSRQTTMLIVGEEGWPLEADGQPALKFVQAQRWQQLGEPLRIVRESEWLGFLGLRSQPTEVQGRYTPAMLSQMLNVPVSLIRGWERTGLIQPVQRIYRLPYFDFQEVANARRLSDLIGAGVPRRDIETSLKSLSEVLGNVARPLAQLEILAGATQLVYRDQSGRLKTVSGQRLFDFVEPEPQEETSDAGGPSVLPFASQTAPPAKSAAERFTAGCRLADVGDLEGALTAFREAARFEPTSPELQFHLADVLYRMQNILGAFERYRIAVELDHDYVEAWTQLGCLAVELQDSPTAIDAFQSALDIHSDYPDAHYHLAEVLSQAGRMEEAVTHWQRYLEFDQRGPWAASARERLEGATGGTP